MSALEQFTQDTRTWLETNCPASQRGPAKSKELYYGGKQANFPSDDAKIWFERMLEKGWVAPDWPTEYGGGGLDAEHTAVIKREMKRLGCRAPLNGHGLMMFGPALLEYGTEAQKLEHMPAIVRGEIRWCQGFSEPGAGSDLASLRCKAEDKGDHWLVNGSKLWTTNADVSDWIFVLVRTDFDVKKQAGISFLLADMNDPGIQVKPITLLDGNCDFCATFFDNVKVPKDNIVNGLNQGWTVAKRLLEHEREYMSDLQSFMPKPKYTPIELAKMYCPLDAGGKLANNAMRQQLAEHLMNKQAMHLLQTRARDEGIAGVLDYRMMTCFKFYGTEEDKRGAEVLQAIMGERCLGWDENNFEDHEMHHTGKWMQSKVLSMGGGTSEVQLNIVAKAALGLPD